MAEAKKSAEDRSEAAAMSDSDITSEFFDEQVKTSHGTQHWCTAKQNQIINFKVMKKISDILH